MLKRADTLGIKVRPAAPLWRGGMRRRDLRNPLAKGHAHPAITRPFSDALTTGGPASNGPKEDRQCPDRRKKRSRHQRARQVARRSRAPEKCPKNRATEGLAQVAESSVSWSQRYRLVFLVILHMDLLGPQAVDPVESRNLDGSTALYWVPPVVGSDGRLSR